ncbi:Cobalt-zinc-cadmium resistance protein CzcB [Pontiella desulfatans]|uniref:Cobalt-zinc-cadmium resistance protein CzcB n=1 Tax=Pontiella desulfatans TaxID=2750659 RepID=A0A6C2UEI5_PONDE|nr:efflux RND transporter periplasmic adaptor subunit [Pontiella desulfatans]VGO17626.1 Cobalt-zinc-cadmium resistance protein CzcB [Pontiella desulfatans]
MKQYWIITLLGLAVAVFGQQAEKDMEVDCDCPSCREKAASGKEFSLPGLQGLDAANDEQVLQPAQVEPDQDHSHDHADHEPEAVPHDHDGDGVPDHGDDAHAHDSHDGHDHGAHAAEGITFTQEVFEKTGIRVHEAEGGSIAKTSSFPAEIKLNRDRTAAVSPRYASIVRQVFAEIGDTVRKGDVLASLENRETMAVYTVAAPQDGVIISKDLAVGEIAADGKVLYEVADLSTVWADISIFPQYQHKLRKGMPVGFIAHDGHTARGTIKYISPIVSEQTRTFTARCVLEGARDDFSPGAFVRARIDLETVDAQVAVPREAVQTIEGENVVFVPSPQGFIAAPVKTGLADDMNVEIKAGLNPGDRFVAVGAFVLKAQMVTSGMDPHAGHGH